MSGVISYRTQIVNPMFRFGAGGAKADGYAQSTCVHWPNQKVAKEGAHGVEASCSFGLLRAKQIEQLIISRSTIKIRDDTHFYVVRQKSVELVDVGSTKLGEVHELLERVRFPLEDSEG